MRPSYQLRPPALLLPACMGILFGAPLLLSAQGGQAAPPAAPPPTLAEIRAEVTPEDIGDSLLYHRRYQEAIKQYRKATGNSSDLWDKMGIAYQMLSDIKDATRCYKQSLRLKPTNELALNNLATVYELQSQYGKAEGMYRKALDLDPSSAKIAMNLGTVLMIESRYNQGSGFYKRALALDPDVFDRSEGPVFESGVPLKQRGAMNYFKARHCAQSGMADRAVKYLEQAVSEGFTTPNQIARDTTFASLRGNPAFERLIADHQN